MFAGSATRSVSSSCCAIRFFAWRMRSRYSLVSKGSIIVSLPSRLILAAVECAQRQYGIGTGGDQRLVERHEFVRPMRLVDDAAGSEKDNGHRSVALQESAVARRRPAPGSKIGCPDIVRRPRQRGNQRMV